MAKRHRDWAGENADGVRVTRKALIQAQNEVESSDIEYNDVDLDKTANDVLAVAHEALSKLYTKSHKRERTMRGVRRKDAWQ
ncbi:MAG: hypothetical protein KC476_00570 [Cyanobacteria bacterium HKST-UBA06]|nr:hypothetical protein [Cyanobacteria bacterium HKST-UBA05]MCA9800260.1 hypothetical protein [Cyanobacteria bacterium HKST-UBA04]MCA9806422.1 hypothetical protein [Cyanobacteria bacterium HKST-UBA06]MCA9840574.1 hypothetical protein [Cyanobacteria bacterium HKST-UBA03]